MTLHGSADGGVQPGDVARLRSSHPFPHELCCGRRHEPTRGSCTDIRARELQTYSVVLLVICCPRQIHKLRAMWESDAGAPIST